MNGMHDTRERYRWWNFAHREKRAADATAWVGGAMSDPLRTHRWWPKGLPSSHISPVGGVWWLSGGGGMICNGDEAMRIQERWTDDRSGLTSSNTFPDIYAFPPWIPDTAL